MGVSKPLSWFPRPDILQSVIDKCLPVFKDQNKKVWKWLETPNERYFNGRQPLDLCSDEAGLAEFVAYLAQWNGRDSAHEQAAEG